MCEEYLLADIKEYQFYAIELNLYLDNFPNNSDATKLFKKISKKLDSLIKEFEEEYGPLTNFGSAFEENPKAWVSSPWPWESKN